jgi:uncharacterized damage-inducible protein DinB
VVDAASLLVELYGRVEPLAHEAIKGLSRDELVAQPAPGANTIAWLVWHTARVEDHHVSEILDANQVWVDGPWAERFGLEPDPANTGYGHGPADVRAVVPVEPSDLERYLEAVQARTMVWLRALTAEDLDRIVDRRWDPPVTMGVRLVSIADDALQHLGQAAYVRGLLGH